MKTYLAVILSATTVAALLAAPGSAQSRYYRYGAYAAYGAYGSSGYGSYGPYAPNVPTPRYGRSYDFQGGGGNR